ncbi:MAG: hypothetical protein MI924_15610 [Chloroflexales bacterium]|nr:hypothetical protein [Chloroflexales bacterium]
MPKAIYTEVVIPDIVRNAITLATQLGFPMMPEGRQPGYQGLPSACVPQVGRLLHVLAASKQGGRIGEQGTGAGVGTAWLASWLAGSATLLSVDINVRYAEAVADLFRDDPRVTIQTGDWHTVMHSGEPFDLLFY